MKKVLIIDDHDVVRDGVRRILGEQQSGAFRFGEASNVSDALRMVQEEHWDAAIIDLSLGGQSGLELLREIKQLRPRLPVLILSMYSEEQYARRAFKAGAAGYLTKDSPRAELVKATARVIGGGRYVSAIMAEKLIRDLERGSDLPLHESLSDREFQVMCMIASGKTVGEIAASLSLSDKTISTYRARLLEKLGMKTNAEVTRYAIRNNIVT
ncbi:MAG TPA: response regulator transcription factor [Bryobacteraceae bacterium]|nr:response regulator transcription factor [Bryobacteraceae bacterium]